MSQRTISVKLEADVDEYQRKMRESSRTTETTGEEVEGTRQSLDLLGQAARRVAPMLGAAALGRGFRDAVDGAVELETTLTRMETLVGLTGDEVDALSGSFSGIGRETGKTAQELAEAAFFISSSGLRGADAIETLEIAARASAVGMGETTVVADLLTSALNSYGEENLTASRAGDILTGAVREGKLGADELAGSLGQLLPVASSMDISFEQVAGTMAVLSRTGTDAATGATTLNSMMMNLVSESPQARDALADVGLSMSDLRDIAAGSDDGLIQVMRLLDESFDGNDEALRAVIPNVQAFRGAMSLLAQDSEAVDEVMRGVTDSTGLLDEAMDGWSATTEAELARTRAAWQELKDELGTQVLPALGGALSQFNQATERSLGGLNEQLGALARGDFFTAFLGSDPLNLLGDAIEDVAGKASTASGSFNDMKNAVDDTGDAASDTAHEFADLVTSTDRLIESTAAYIDQARAQVDPVYAVHSASQALADAQAEVNRLNREGKTDTEEYEQALWNELGAAQDVDFALREMAVALDEAGVSTSTARERMELLKDEYGLSDDAARELIRRMEEYSDTATSLPNIHIDATGNAWDRMAELARMRAGLWSDRSRTDYGRQTRARGGPVSQGQPYLVGEEGPELVTFGHSGFVHDAQTTAQMMQVDRSVSVSQNFHVQPSQVELFRAREQARALAEAMA